MFTLVNILALVIGLGIGLFLGKRYIDRDEMPEKKPLITFAPHGVILLNGEEQEEAHPAVSKIMEKLNEAGFTNPDKKSR